MRFLYFFILTLCFSSFLQAENSYDIIDLNPPESISSAATDINELGQVTGYYQKKNDKTYYLFFWDKEKGFELLGEAQTVPRINNLGHIITSKTVGSVKYHPYIWSSEKGEQLLDIPKELKNETFINLAINDYDQVLIRNNTQYSHADRTWIWHEGLEEITDLTSANHLNNSQLIAGVVMTQTGKYEKIFIPTIYDLQSKTAVPIDFADKKGVTGYVKMINDRGSALGRVYDKATGTQKYFSWHADTGVKYYSNFTPLWINNNGETVGWKINPLLNFSEVHLFDGLKYKNIEIETGIGYDVDVPFRAISTLYRFNSQLQFVGQGKILKNGVWIYHAFIIQQKKPKKSLSENLGE